MATLAVTEAVSSIAQAESLFGLSRSVEPGFFVEWQEGLPELSPGEEAACDRIKASYLYNSAEGPLTESTVNLLLVSPLLYLSGFCDPPFKLRAESPVSITAENDGVLLRGRIDALVLQSQIWLTLVESKQAKFSFSIAIPQALAYLMGSPNQSEPLFGMVTNGDGFLFIKLEKRPQPIYARSDDFSLFRQSKNELYRVLRILKRFQTNVG
ncbi:type I restriction endonuclease subunit R [cf. Phormidesmis sp. LEGE 11477]|uniref:type I restriction endonuclease subunit R n=1 Tax=cf. Phormidesmis sp. LEGE 11477 TaxID=1828680 RepID=UPI001882C689|nr:type I restriction endonuclease subunit R [cf. Phormidesmis sp. LEGE 11477]MBE9063216.1 type I restriction endonuclease subunit R [cf. Phormidesmis sp. LEGE 11477]